MTKTDRTGQAGRSWLAGIALVLCVIAAMPAMADPGDKAGWSVLTDPRGRAFLIWVPQADGQRVITFGCLRDADTFSTFSPAVGDSDEEPKATLTLSNGSGQFEVEGSITRLDGQPTFVSELDADARQLRALARKLLAVLEAPGDLTLTIAPARTGAAAKQTRQIPTAGLASVLGRFRQVCLR